MNRKTRGEVNRLLKSVANERDTGMRGEAISARFLGLPYVVNSLGGGAGLPERLTIRLDAFDCVTYIETVLALARSGDAEEFEANLIRIRYKNGEVSWQKRNHYMVDWWRNNEREGFIRNITRGGEAVVKTRVLNVVEGLPIHRVTFRTFPKRKFKSLANRIETGDLVCFASAKRNLDVFHTGILIRREEEVMLRHATRTVGRVIEQSLEDFLRNRRMSGIVLIRALGA